MSIKRRWLWLGAAVCCILVGCSRFTPDNFRTVSEGDDQATVRSKIGDPTNDLIDAWYYENRDRDWYAAVIFDNDQQVRRKVWLTNPMDVMRVIDPSGLD